MSETLSFYEFYILDEESETSTNVNFTRSLSFDMAACAEWSGVWSCPPGGETFSYCKVFILTGLSFTGGLPLVIEFFPLVLEHPQDLPGHVDVLDQVETGGGALGMPAVAESRVGVLLHVKLIWVGFEGALCSK